MPRLITGTGCEPFAVERLGRTAWSGEEQQRFTSTGVVYGVADPAVTCYAPRHVPLAALARVAGRRWTVEEDFQAGKGLAGLDEHQVRRWDSWHRWVTRAMLAAAFLTITAAAEHASGPPPDGQIPLTRNEISHLFATLLIKPVRDAWHPLRWSSWRRRHQHRARTCHYQRQAREP